MVESDRAMYNRVYHEFEEGDEVTVPDHIGRSFINKGTAIPADEDDQQEADAFANADERETKPEDTDELEVPEVSDVDVKAEPTSENSNWYQFRKRDGTLVTDEDGDIFKVLGAKDRDTALELMNE